MESLALDGMNCTRVFVGSYVERGQDIPWMKSNNTLAPRPGRLLAPWARSGVEEYRNGGNWFNLDKWDEAYFARLRSFAQVASTKGIVVELTPFENQYRESQWANPSLKASNNIQGTGGRWQTCAVRRRVMGGSRETTCTAAGSGNRIGE